MWPREFLGLYGFSDELTAHDQCVAIIALGGGYLATDVAAAAQAMSRPEPLVTDVSVDGTTNAFAGGTAADQEIALDMQVLLGVAPAVRIAIYFAASNIGSIATALRKAVADDVNRPSVISISWGSAETFWPADARNAVQAALDDAARVGITVIGAAGDWLGTAGVTDGAAHVLFPASSPSVLSCGGTQVNLSENGAVADEVVWNDVFTGTGGGISDIFATPEYQKDVMLPKSFNDGMTRRGVPDVAFAAASTPGYRIVLGGQQIVKDGTSAAAPFWAGIVSLANQKRGRPLGQLHTFLYAHPELCRAITKGDNRTNGVGYDAGFGWNACTGLGVPNGNELIDALAAVP